ncbi:MAG TPA: DUF935 family protein, partial [Bacteroidales bacterium]|nr:DUF935 family protein [Bacteroidales bacterium]
MTDPHLTAAVQQRKNQILQMDWEIVFDHAEKTEEEKILQEKAEKLLISLPLKRIMSEILDCILYGMTVQEIMYDINSEEEYEPVAIEAKPQEWFIFTTKNELRMRKKLGTGYVFEEGERLPNLKFIVNRHNATYNNPYGEKILSRCYWPVTFKRAATEFWQLMVERYGMPFLIGYHPAGWTQNQVDVFLDQLKEMISENVFAFPDTLKNMIELKESPQYNIGQLYEILIRHHNSEISKAVLTVTLTTEMQRAGSYKAAEIHKEMLAYIGLSDKKLVEDCINRKLQYCSFLNWGHVKAPKIILKKKDKMMEENHERDRVLRRMGVRFTKEYYKKRYKLNDEDFEVDE